MQNKVLISLQQSQENHNSANVKTQAQQIYSAK